MLLDIKMPGMDGVEVLQKAKELFPDLPVVMMTAYATVETAVEAMKIGALDYLIKPFDPDALIPKVIQIYQSLSTPPGPELEVGAIVMSGGTSYYNPAEGKDTYGYGSLPDVVTSIEFERLLSGTGPSGGKLRRPSDGRPITRIAWLQCVGSRDIQNDADFCSNICCMYAIKEAMVARERAARSRGFLGHLDLLYGHAHLRQIVPALSRPIGSRRCCFQTRARSQRRPGPVGRRSSAPLGGHGRYRCHGPCRPGGSECGTCVRPRAPRP
jgi:CheY-like chemotaxis protein